MRDTLESRVPLGNGGSGTAGSKTWRPLDVLTPSHLWHLAAALIPMNCAPEVERSFTYRT